MRARRSPGAQMPARPGLARFGAALATAREAADVSQEALAWDTGLHRTAISLLERGLREPRLETLVVLGRALGISPGEMLGWYAPLDEFNKRPLRTGRKRGNQQRSHDTRGQRVTDAS